MGYLNRAQIMGQIFGDIKGGNTSGGLPYIKFTVSTEYRTKKRRKWQYHTIMMFQSAATHYRPLLRAWQWVFLEGTIMSSTFKDIHGLRKEKFFIVPIYVQLLTGTFKPSIPQEETTDFSDKPLEDDAPFE